MLSINISLNNQISVYRTVDAKNVRIDEELFRQCKADSIDDRYKLYTHLMYIKYIEGCMCFLSCASEHGDGDSVTISKADLKRIAATLYETRTYG